MKRPRDDEDSDLNELILDEEDERKLNREEERINQILSHASEEQVKRYWIMRHANFFLPSAAKDERFVNLIKSIGNLKAPPSEPVLIAINAAAKIYIGELVEEGLQLAAEQGEAGPLSTNHLHQARMKLRKTAKRIL